MKKVIKHLKLSELEIYFCLEGWMTVMKKMLLLVRAIYWHLIQFSILIAKMDFPS